MPGLKIYDLGRPQFLLRYAKSKKNNKENAIRNDIAASIRYIFVGVGSFGSEE
jgi:hypothetical protein